VSQQLGTLQTHTTDTFLFISHTTNVVFIGVRIIKEIPGSVVSGTPYITRLASNEIFSPSNKIHREVGRAKFLSASLYNLILR